MPRFSTWTNHHSLSEICHTMHNSSCAAHGDLVVVLVAHHISRELLGVTTQWIKFKAMFLNELLEDGMRCKPHPVPLLPQLDSQCQERLRL